MCEKNGCWAFIFDSGRLGSCWYGEVVFKHMLQGKELVENPAKMVVSLGDIFIGKRHIDIEPYVYKDDYCTINFDHLNEEPFQDFPYCWIVEDLDADIAVAVDERLKSDLEGYVGLSRIDTSNVSLRKQFWKRTIRKFVLFGNTITCFQDPELEGDFAYAECANELGYKVEYNKEAEYAAVETSEILQSSYVKSEEDLRIVNAAEKDVDRDLFTLNFSLRQELQISGVLIWRAVNDLDKVRFGLQGDAEETLIEYPFLALYHASQGIERIQKAVVELICKKNHIEEKEKSSVLDLLTSHSHDGLNQWIQEHESVKFNKNCRKLIGILGRFYNTVRYVRYSDEGCMQTTAPEYHLLRELKSSNSSNADFEIKNNFGRCLGELSSVYFTLFEDLCRELNIYAYELEYSSAAVIVYYQDKSKPNNLYAELKRRQKAKKEVLYWLMKRVRKYPKRSYAKERALDFDSEMIEKYLWDIIYNPEDGQDCFDEVSCLYDELCSRNKDRWKKRIELIDWIFDE